MNEKSKAINRARSTAGKRVGGAIYLHFSATNELAKLDAEAVQNAKSHLPVSFVWSVVKISRKPRLAVSFLDYEDIDEIAFPALRRSCQVDLATGKTSVREYSGANPPILHRKELLLSLDDPRRGDFAELTRRLEAAGLFTEMHKKGWRRPWRHALSKAGLDENGAPLR